MSETGDRVDGPSRPRDETSDHPSGMIRQPALRARGKYVSKSDMVTDALRELITDRQLSPGTPLRQRDLAEQFDVSYTPVREALRRLESEGLVVTDVHRGATVARTESQEMEENYRILAALEALAGSLAVSKMTNDDVTEIEALYRQVAACQPDDDRLAELNRQFHFRIYECARSPMLLLLLRLLWRSFPRGPQAGRPHQESVRQHAQLVRALKRRNEEEVAAIIRDHVIGSTKYLPQQEALPRSPAVRNGRGRPRGVHAGAGAPVVTGWDHLGIAGLSRHAFRASRVLRRCLMTPWPRLPPWTASSHHLSRSTLIALTGAAEVGGGGAEERRWRGSCMACRFAVKEVFDVENLTATYGSQARFGAVAVPTLRSSGGSGVGALLMIKSGQPY
jgi:DNA-binding GntR family transcriptional regulator